MELIFEIYDLIGAGFYGDFVQYYDTQGQLFNVQNGDMFGKETREKLNGVFNDVYWESDVKVLNDEKNIRNLEIKTLNGFGLIGSYVTDDRQVMIIYEFQYNIDRYLNKGSVKYTINNPISQFDLTLENPINELLDTQEKAILGENSSLLTPSAKVIIKYKFGNDIEEYPLGTFYIDKSSYDILSETARVDGRNIIGKALKDQTLNEKYNLTYKKITDIYKELLDYANIERDQYEVEESNEYRYFTFEPTMDILRAIEEINKAMVNWRIEENVNSEIIIGTSGFNRFDSKNRYKFERNKDVFSRQISLDDQETYRKVCVHDKDFNIKIYRDVETFTGWNLRSNKTLFVEVPEGTTVANANAIADSVAERVGKIGKIETFTSPFRPQLICGDEAVIIDENGETTLGLVTEVTHSFGKDGFYTTFTVDSGGTLGKGRLSDYISMIKGERTAGQIGYEEIIEE